MSRIIQTIITLVAIFLGLLTIIVAIGNPLVVMGILSITFGILAIIWTIKANLHLSAGSSLKIYTHYFLLALVSIILFSIWDTLNRLLLWEQNIGEFMAYPEYFFITIAYLIFALAGFQILKVGKTFGFNQQAKEIKKVIDKKKRGKKKR